MKKKEKVILLLSGGLDSVTLLYWAIQHGYDVEVLMVDYKQAHVQEINFGKTHCHRLHVLYRVEEVPALNGLTDESWIVPHRNAILISLAVNMAVQKNASGVMIGCNADDAENFPDCRGGFIESQCATVRAAGYNVKVLAPFLEMSKREIWKLAKQYGVTPGEIWTCYRGGAKPCGNCPACKKLEVALCGE